MSAVMGIQRGYGLVVVMAVCLAIGRAAPLEEQEDVKEYKDILMPGVHPQVNDTYMCRSMEVDEDYVYITGFIPHADMNTAHHMLLYGCVEPGSNEESWNCGEMVAPDTSYPVAPVCGNGGQQTVYAWAMDAPSLALPGGVGFKVGRNTNIKYLVLQVHYKDVTQFVSPNTGIDSSSGLTLVQTREVQPKTAGTYLLIAGGDLQPHSVTYMESACGLGGDIVMHPFAFRTHTHSHGLVVSGYRVRDGEWTEIGRRSPQDPEMFYNATTPDLEIIPGDMLASRCTMKNDEDRIVQSGSTTHDEMCDFYVMYWVDGDDILDSDSSVCYTPGPPEYHWYNSPELQSENAPREASIVPGTDEVVESTEPLPEVMADDMDNMDGYKYGLLDEVLD